MESGDGGRRGRVGKISLLWRVHQTTGHVNFYCKHRKMPTLQAEQNGKSLRAGLCVPTTM